MLYKPYFAKYERGACPKRAKTNPTIGEPEEWFSEVFLGNLGLFGVSFDFFVDWSNHTLSNEFWIKRLVTREQIPSRLPGTIASLIQACDGELPNRMMQFAAPMNKTVKYKLFRDEDWWEIALDKECMLDVTLTDQGQVAKKAEGQSLRDLKKEIQRLSGGTVKIGKKGLTYSYTRLECYLSKTDAAWPGDIDMLLLNQSCRPVAILEFKKHTLGNQPMENYLFSRYYSNKKDKRKYDRLAILRDSFHEEIPIYILYYPTTTNVKNVLIEQINGAVGQLVSSGLTSYSLPMTDDVKLQLINHVR